MSEEPPKKLPLRLLFEKYKIFLFCFLIFTFFLSYNFFIMNEYERLHKRIDGLEEEIKELRKGVTFTLMNSNRRSNRGRGNR